MWDLKPFNIYALCSQEKSYVFYFYFVNITGLTRVNQCNPEPDSLVGSTPRSGLITMVIMKIYFLICYIFELLKCIKKSI